MMDQVEVTRPVGRLVGFSRALAVVQITVSLSTALSSIIWPYKNLFVYAIANARRKTLTEKSFIYLDTTEM